MMPQIVDLVRRIRPAALASAVAYVCGLSKRRIARTESGIFLIDQISELGYALSHGEYEPTMIAVLRRYLKPGSTFIDLGANEGYFTVIGSRLVGSKGIVIAVEPQTRLERILRSNLALNDCYNVRLVKAALASRSGKVQLQLSSTMNPGGSSLFQSTKYPLRTEEVKSLTLADLLDKTGVETCDLIKVDIEGAEYDVFMGAAEILKAGMIKHIALEIHNSILERRRLSGRALHEFILACGYRLNDELGNWVYTFPTI